MLLLFHAGLHVLQKKWGRGGEGKGGRLFESGRLFIFWALRVGAYLVQGGHLSKVGAYLSKYST